MTENDMKYLHSLFARFGVATIENYNGRTCCGIKRNNNDPERLSSDLKRQDDILKKIVIQNEFLLNNIAFLRDKNV